MKVAALLLKFHRWTPVEANNVIKKPITVPSFINEDIQVTRPDLINPTTADEEAYIALVPAVSPNLDQADCEEQKEHFKTLASSVFEGIGPRMFIIHGGPGSGKSVLAKHFLDECEKFMTGSVVPTATAGIAAHVLSQDDPELGIRGAKKATMFQNALGYGRGKRTSINQLPKAQKTFKGAKGILIDEFSMLGADALANIDSSLRLITGKKEPFGGIVVILVEDLFQLPAVKQAPILDDFEYLEKFHVLSLQAQRRSKDPVHTSILNNLRHPDTLSSGLKTLVESLRELSSEDREFMGAPVIVVTNRERCVLNRVLAVADARRRRVPVLSFQMCEGATTEETFYFVQGGPAVMSEKEEGTPLVNGLQVTMSSFSKFPGPS